MPIQAIHTFLVHPARGQDGHSIRGAAVDLAGPMFALLGGIYDRSERECDIDIVFNSTAGLQQNECRNLLLAYLADPTLTTGRVIAQRLESVTDRRSGLGLLFMISGREGRDHKIVISRFPTDTAILADERDRTLSVEFLERVFMKSKTSYKVVVYRHSSLRNGFWEGRAIDRQKADQLLGLPNYWIAQFLLSDVSVTPAAGTKRMAIAFREAAKNAEDLQVKNEIAAVATLARGLNNERVSISDVEERFGLSPEARAAIQRELKTPELAAERFHFDFDEFVKVVAYRSVELDNGGVLTAPSGQFNDVFERDALPGADGRVRFSTQGRIVGERLTKAP